MRGRRPNDPAHRVPGVLDRLPARRRNCNSDGWGWGVSAKIEWDNNMASTQPSTTGRLPKKPVIWIGEIGLQLPSGEKDIRSWRSNQPLRCDQARTVLGQLHASLVGEHGKDSAIHSWFWCKSR